MLPPRPRAVGCRLLRPACAPPAGRSVRAVASSPPLLRLSGWRKDGRHVPPYSIWKAKQEEEQKTAEPLGGPAAAPSRLTLPGRTRNVRHPPLEPMVDPRWTTAYSFCKDLLVTYHLADDGSAALPLARLRALVLNPLARHLAGLHGAFVLGNATIRGPLGVAFTFARAAGAPADPADDTVLAVVHAADLAARLDEGKPIESLCECLDDLRSQLGSGGKIVLFVLDIAQVAEDSLQGTAREASIRQTLRSAELASGSQTFVNYLDSTGSPSPAIALLSSIAALAEGPHRRQEDDIEHIRALAARE